MSILLYIFLHLGFLFSCFTLLVPSYSSTMTFFKSFIINFHSYLSRACPLSSLLFQSLANFHFFNALIFIQCILHFPFPLSFIFYICFLYMLLQYMVNPNFLIEKLVRNKKLKSISTKGLSLGSNSTFDWTMEPSTVWLKGHSRK